MLLLSFWEIFMISEDAQNKTDSILRQSGSDSMTQDEINFANAMGITAESECDCYKLAHQVLIERVSMDSNQGDTLVRVHRLANANGCSLSNEQPTVNPARIPVIGGSIE